MLVEPRTLEVSVASLRFLWTVIVQALEEVNAGPRDLVQIAAVAFAAPSLLTRVRLELVVRVTAWRRDVRCRDGGRAAHVEVAWSAGEN